jgi:hypothetical protein
VNAIAYRIPPVAVQLGTVLDLDVTTEHGTRLFIKEWRHWLMLTSSAGMDASPGRARLYLVKVTPRRVALDVNAVSERAAETFGRWHERDAANAFELDGLPDSIAYYQGRVLRIGYRSDKWHERGAKVDYDHDCQERGARPPRLYTSAASVGRSRAAVLVGGSMHITERGIE